MVYIFYIPPGHRDTAKLLFTKAVAQRRSPDYSKLLYLVPAYAHVEEAQKVFHRLQGTTCYIPPEITTIGGYARRLYAHFGRERVLPTSLIPPLLSKLTGKGLGFSNMLAGFIRDLKQHYPGKECDEIRLDITAMLHELAVPDIVTESILDALAHFKTYQVFLKHNGLVDAEDVVAQCAAVIEEGHPAPGACATLIVDGFYAPSAAEKMLLKALMQKAGDTFLAIPYDPRFSSLTGGFINFLKEHFAAEVTFVKDNGNDEAPLLHYYACADVEEEVEGIARNIKSLYLSGKVRDLEEIVVLFPDLADRSAMVRRVFRRYGIPCRIMRRQPLGAMRPFLDLLGLIDSIISDYPRLKFSLFLSSNYFHRMPETLRRFAPSLSLQSGIVAGKDAWLDFVAEGSEVLDISSMPERAEIEKSLKWVFKKLSPLEEIKEGAPFGVHAAVLKKLLDDLGFPGPLTDPVAKERHEAMSEVFTQLALLGELYSPPVTLAEFGEILRHLLNAASLEADESGVRVMGFLDAHGLSFPYLFFGGLSDDAIPLRQDMDYLLPDSLKKSMDLMHLEKYNSLQKFVFTGIIKAARTIHLSYPMMDGDALFLPSSFLYSGEEARERIPGIFSKEEHLIRNGREPFLNLVGEITVVPALLKLPTPLRVTDIDAYRACPRRFFIERVLQLSPVEIKEYEIEAATLGTIMHKVMERLLQEPVVDIETLRQKAALLCDEVMKNRKMHAYWKELIRDSFIEILPAIYEKELELREEGYAATEVEKSITGEPLKGIRLRGKIDRIDTIGDSVQIIDYKTGTAGLNCTQALSGNEQLQLFLYAAILKSHGYKVRRVGIYSLKDISIKWCPPKGRGRGQGTKGRDNAGIDEYINASLKLLEETVARIKKGDFRAEPLNDYACWNCHENAFCPYVQQ
ncbi:MAG: PD-(D/E)XK nuclease family protein [Nitrospirota bacterium]